jgi:hypothetical protein
MRLRMRLSMRLRMRYLAAVVPASVATAEICAASAIWQGEAASGLGQFAQARLYVYASVSEYVLDYCTNLRRRRHLAGGGRERVPAVRAGAPAHTLVASGLIH